MKNSRVDHWNKVRETKVKPMFAIKKILVCELDVSKDCARASFLGFAHRHERSWYYDCPELLHDFTQVVLACQPCHKYLDDPMNADYKEQVFMQKRGKENKPENKPIKTKRATWMKSRTCKFCKRINPGMAQCPNCKNWDIS